MADSRKIKLIAAIEDWDIPDDIPRRTVKAPPVQIPPVHELPEETPEVQAPARAPSRRRPMTMPQVKSGPRSDDPSSWGAWSITPGHLFNTGEGSQATTAPTRPNVVPLKKSSQIPQGYVECPLCSRRGVVPRDEADRLKSIFGAPYEGKKTEVPKTDEDKELFRRAPGKLYIMHRGDRYVLLNRDGNQVQNDEATPEGLERLKKFIQKHQSTPTGKIEKAPRQKRKKKTQDYDIPDDEITDDVDITDEMIS